MLTGTADADALAVAFGAPTITAFAPEPVVLDGVVTVAAVVELRRADRAALLPPGLHPTDPPTLSIQAWRVGDSPWGPFTACFTRLSCRSGARARALTTAMVVDGDAAQRGLAATFGFPARSGQVQLDRSYDRVDVAVQADDRLVLALAGVDPQPLGTDDVQHTSTMNLAHTPSGLRLVQVEARHDTVTVDRVRARIRAFDGATWGDPGFDPYHVVTTTVSVETAITLPAVRFVCRPDVNAFEGTEPV